MSLLGKWRELTSQEAQDMRVPAAASGCNRLYINDDMMGPKDAVGMDIRLATGHLVRETCIDTRDVQMTERAECVRKQDLYLADARGINQNPSLTSEQRKAALDDLGKTRALCTIDPAFDGKTNMCNMYENNGIHLAECDCTHASQVPSVQYALAVRCKKTLDQGDLTSEDCENLETGKGLPDNYRHLKDVPLHNLIARYMTRAAYIDTLGQGNYKTCNYPGCNVLNPNIHVDALEAARVKPDCKVPMCVINMQQKWGADSTMRIVGNRITLNCNRQGDNCSGNGAKQPDGSCICNSGFSGDQCQIAQSSSGTGQSQQSKDVDTARSPAAATESVLDSVLSWIKDYWYVLVVGFLVLFVIFILMGRISEKQGNLTAKKQQQMVKQLVQLDKQIKLTGPS